MNAARRWPRRAFNAPRAALAVFACLALLVPFLGHAPNRLMSGEAIWLHGGMWSVAAASGLLLLACLRQGRLVELAALGLGGLALVLTCIAAGDTAAALARQAPPAARTLLGGGFWMLVFAYCLVMVDAVQRLRAGPLVVLLVACAVPGLLALLAAWGRFDHLSLAQEAASHRAGFAAALLRHVLLVAATLAISLALGVPLGVAVQSRAGWRPAVFTLLNVVQTVPSVALFGLLIAPLAAAGLSGIGVVPALVALVLYALLPIVRSMVAGLDGVDAATRQAARGMGFSARQMLFAVELPLAAPALIAGLRIVVVQTIGLAVVAALIGAGGLGDFVFQGLGQYAVDLVLLGALPAIGLALAADLALRLLARKADPSELP